VDFAVHYSAAGDCTQALSGGSRSARAASRTPSSARSWGRRSRGHYGILAIAGSVAVVSARSSDCASDGPTCLRPLIRSFSNCSRSRPRSWTIRMMSDGRCCPAVDDRAGEVEESAQRRRGLGCLQVCEGVGLYLHERGRGAIRSGAGSRFVAHFQDPTGSTAAATMRTGGGPAWRQPPPRLCVLRPAHSPLAFLDHRRMDCMVRLVFPFTDALSAAPSAHLDGEAAADFGPPESGSRRTAESRTRKRMIMLSMA
jgi:hypothetical protein